MHSAKLMTTSKRCSGSRRKPASAPFRVESSGIPPHRPRALLSFQAGLMPLSRGPKLTERVARENRKRWPMSTARQHTGCPSSQPTAELSGSVRRRGSTHPSTARFGSSFSGGRLTLHLTTVEASQRSVSI